MGGHPFSLWGEGGAYDLRLFACPGGGGARLQPGVRDGPRRRENAWLNHSSAGWMRGLLPLSWRQEAFRFARYCSFLPARC